MHIKYDKCNFLINNNLIKTFGNSFWIKKDYMYTLQIFLCINLLKINGMKQEFIIFLYIPLYFYVHVIMKIL